MCDDKKRADQRVTRLSHEFASNVRRWRTILETRPDDSPRTYALTRTRVFRDGSDETVYHMVVSLWETPFDVKRISRLLRIERSRLLRVRQSTHLSRFFRVDESTDARFCKLAFFLVTMSERNVPANRWICERESV
jgi:hypothetical protein